MARTIRNQPNATYRAEKAARQSRQQSKQSRRIAQTVRRDWRATEVSEK